MHLSTFKSLNKKFLCGGILFIIISLFLTSCDNFLKADEIKDEIEKVIDYNNAQKVPVLIRAVDGTGSFLVDGEKYFTVNYSEEIIQFTENKNGCIFLGLEAVCKTNPSISREDCVEISTISSDSINGVHTYGVKIIKKVNDILIRPKCILRPAVIQYSPLDTEFSSDPITIKFNTPLQDISVSQDNCILDFTNISIKCNNTYIEDCFNYPILSEDKTVLYIYPDCDKFNAFLRTYHDNYIPTVEITVSLDSRTVFNVNGYSVQFANNNNLTFTSRYSTEVETTPPLTIGFAIFKNWDNNNKLPLEPFFYTDEDHFEYNFAKDDINQSTDYLSYYDDDSIILNRTKGTVYMYGKYKDTGSGIKIIKVNEQFVPTLYPNEHKLPEGDTWNITVNYSKESPEVLYWDTDNSGITTFCIKHEIKHKDCTVQLETTVYDACGNSAATTYYTLIKINSLSLEDSKLLNVYFGETKYYYEEDVEYEFSPKSFSKALRNVKLIYEPEDEDYDDLVFCDDIFAVFLADRGVDPDGIYKTFECRYIDDYGKLQKIPMNKYEYDDYDGAKNWNCDIINVQNLNDLTVTIYIEDDMGNYGSKDYTFSSTPVITDIEDDGDSKTISWIRRTNTSPNTLVLLSKESDDSGTETDDTEETWYVNYYEDDFTIDDGYDYYFIATDVYGCLASELSPKYTYNSDFSTPVSNLTFDGNYVLTSSDKIGETNVTVKIPQNLWNNFENIFVSYRGRNYYFEHNTTEVTFPANTTSLFTNSYSFTLYGENNGICKKGQTKSLHTTDINYDNVPPEVLSEHIIFSHDEKRLESWLIGVEEFESGLQSATFNGDPYTLIKYNDYFPEEYSHPEWYVFALNMYDCIDYTSRFPYLDIRIVATDKAGNEKEIYINNRINIESTPIISSKTSSSWKFNTESYMTTVKIFNYSGNNKWDTRTCYLTGYSSMTYNISTWGASNKFIKVMSEYSPAKYYYTGLKYDSSTQTYLVLNSGLYDFLLPNGVSKDSVVVSSDAPVFVHTLVSSYAYDICKNWDIDDWEFYKKEIGPKVFNFSARDQQKYTIPVSEINYKECYVVVAHFADGSSVMSEVMVKE